MKRISLLLLVLAASACGTAAAPDTATITQVSAPNARDVAVSISPNGSHVAFWRPGSNGYDLWVADAGLKHARSIGVSSTYASLPIWSADGRRLAVSASTRSLLHMAVVDIATDSVTYLTDSPAPEQPIQFHPDGDRVIIQAFASGGTVKTFTVSQKTGKISPLLPWVDDPAYGEVSPDGSHIAYFTIGGGISQGWVSDSDGGARHELTKDPYAGFNLGDKIWSPDGKEFLYTSSRTGKSDIWVASLDGTTRQLTTDINNDYQPAWSPDGKEVAFVSDRGRQTDVWVVPATGGDAIRVTDDAPQERDPGWVNDSTLVYTSTQSRGTFWRRAVGDTVESRILPDSIVVDGFWESPDRQWIAFLIDEPNGDDLALMRADGSGLRVISRNANHQAPTWNATSTKLAWASDQGGSMDVYTAETQGNAPPVQVENWPSFEFPAYWSADGKSLVIKSDRESRLGDLWRIPLAGGDTTRLSHIGSVLNASAYDLGGRQHTLVSIAEQASGEISLAEWLPGDKLRIIVSGNPSLGNIADNGLLAVVLPSADKTELEVLRPDGSVVQRLDASGSNAFSPDDRQLLYTTKTGDQQDLAVLDLTTGKTTQLTHTGDARGSMFTAHGDSLVILRTQYTSVLMRAGIGRLLGKR